jgi:hypothetical protein
MQDCNTEASKFSNFINLNLNDIELYKKMVDFIRVRDAILKQYSIT